DRNGGVGGTRPGAGTISSDGRARQRYRPTPWPRTEGVRLAPDVLPLHHHGRDRALRRRWGRRHRPPARAGRGPRHVRPGRSLSGTGPRQPFRADILGGAVRTRVPGRLPSPGPAQGLPAVRTLALRHPGAIARAIRLRSLPAAVLSAARLTR